MKTILSYGQARLAVKKAKTFSTCASVAINAGDALREGYQLLIDVNYDYSFIVFFACLFMLFIPVFYLASKNF